MHVYVWALISVGLFPPGRNCIMKAVKAVLIMLQIEGQREFKNNNDMVIPDIYKHGYVRQQEL